MGLPASQQRVLNEIESKLGEADPRLHSMFRVFTRLTERDAMPGQEAIPTSRFPGAVSARGRRSQRHGLRLRPSILLPTALTAIMCALTAVLGVAGGHRPTVGTSTPAAGQTIVKTSCQSYLSPIASSSCQA